MPLKRQALNRPRQTPLDQQATIAQQTQDAIAQAQTIRRAPKHAQPLPLPPETAQPSKIAQPSERLMPSARPTPAKLSRLGIPLPPGSSPEAGSPESLPAPVPPTTGSPSSDDLFDMSSEPPTNLTPRRQKPRPFQDDWASMEETNKAMFRRARAPDASNPAQERLRHQQRQQEQVRPTDLPRPPQVMETVETPTPTPHRTADDYAAALEQVSQLSVCLWPESAHAQRSDLCDWCAQFIDDLLKNRAHPEVTILISRFWLNAARTVAIPSWTSIDPDTRALLIDRVIALCSSPVIYLSLVGMELTSREEVSVSSPSLVFVRWTTLLIHTAYVQVTSRLGKHILAAE